MNKKPYQAPQISEIGDVTTITAGDTTPKTYIDKTFPSGTKDSDLTYES
jgi:hypothetical protein